MRLLLSVIALALDTLRANKLRSFLTLLGVIIGTGAIIGVGSILAGLDNSVAGLIRNLAPIPSWFSNSAWARRSADALPKNCCASPSPMKTLWRSPSVAPRWHT